MSIENYIAARAAYVEADGRLSAMRGALTTVAAHLANRNGYFAFSNTSIGLPMEYLGGHSFDANAFPTAAMIQQAIADRASTKAKMLDLWHGLPEPTRAALVAPPE